RGDQDCGERTDPVDAHAWIEAIDRRPRGGRLHADACPDRHDAVLDVGAGGEGSVRPAAFILLLGCGDRAALLPIHDLEPRRHIVWKTCSAGELHHDRGWLAAGDLFRIDAGDDTVAACSGG